ncbi:putative glycoside hydrolase [Bacillus sp. V5-8f]|uniref:putative glycoside hydrolase n=1 Tax=Bacillus sp. V5-8f TaxID=2053044 RepID=UPI000C75B051|nr:putative glycoside hydrolase [Bacillus sp. V5-8f]PLT33876.1 GTP-binding protein [Bacillus sp. V5-8f]
MRRLKRLAITGMLCLGSATTLGVPVFAEDALDSLSHPKSEVTLSIKNIPEAVPRFIYDSGLTFKYPNAVRGIYVTGHSAGGSNFGRLVDLVDKTELNAMVIDIKDDRGNVTYRPEDPQSPYAGIGKDYIKKPADILKQMEKKQIYPIARVVVFKDSILSQQRPELSFVDGKEVWKNGREESFVNPFMKEVWDYNVGIAIEAAKMGFQEIQFDYVRFPEGFEKRDSTLKYGLGAYRDIKMDNIQKRVKAVTDFVAYAREKLKPYGVKVSVDIFGYSATLPEAPGIGQNFSKISENVDVISSMIYPSHWTSYFGIVKPDLEPYKLVNEYAKLEKQKLGQLKTPPVSRPWLQDFTASYLGAGNYKKYGKVEVDAQIKALKDNGINEFLLWNAANRYTPNVEYTP